MRTPRTLKQALEEGYVISALYAKCDKVTGRPKNVS